MISAKDVFSRVREASGFKDLDSKSRKGDRPLWRGMYCKLAYEMTEETVYGIGRWINRDHATVVYWKNKFEDEFLTRPDLRFAYEHIKEELEFFRGRLIALDVLDLEAEKIIRSMRPEEELVI